MRFFQSTFSDSLLVAISCGVLALLTASIFRVIISTKPTGTAKMVDIYMQIRSGSMYFLRQEYKVVFGCMFIIGVLLYLFLDTTWEGVVRNQWELPYTTGSFVTGALCSMFAGFVGMRTSTASNVRTTQAARKGIVEAVRIAFMSGATMGLLVVGFGIVGLAGYLLYLVEYVQVTSIGSALDILLGFGLGASLIALCTRVAGGIFTKAADVGADIAGKLESEIEEDDVRNPAVIADNVGDNVGDIAGVGADLFESFVGSLLAAMLIAESSSIFLGPLKELAIVYPLFIAGLGIVATIIGTFAVRTKKGENDIRGALRKGLIISSVLVVLGAYFLGLQLPIGIFFSLVSGVLVGILIGHITEYYTSETSAPVLKIAKSTQGGAATTIMHGLSTGYSSTLYPTVLVCIAIAISYMQAGVYGISIAAVGMMSTLGMIIAVEAFGPVADNASGIAEMAKLPKRVKTRTNMLDSAGNTTAAIGKGFAVSSATLTSIALFIVFSRQAGITSINLLSPSILIGLLIGGAIPYVFSAVTMNAVAHAAYQVADEVRKQFTQNKALLAGKDHADSQACIAIATSVAMREMVFPACIAIGAPIITGFVLGSEALGGMLIGALVTGTLLAISMANTGGALDNAKKYIESGEYGGVGSPSHKASIIGDTVGDPLKDATGPSINILVKLMTIVALMTVGFYSSTGIIG